MAEDLRRRISEDWANSVAERQFEIWTHNGLNAEELSRDVDLNMLGGVVVEFIPSSAYNIRKALLSPGRKDLIIDLSFGGAEIAITDTERLEAATVAHYRSPHVRIVEQLRRRRHDPLLGNEAWIIPSKALEVVTE